MFKSFDFVFLGKGEWEGKWSVCCREYFFARKLRGENEVIIQVLKAESDTEY